MKYLGAVDQVTFGSSTGTVPCDKAYAYAFAGVVVVRGVDAAAAEDCVGAKAAHDEVVSGLTVNYVVGGVAYHGVAIRRSQKILDTAEGVAFGSPTETFPCVQVDSYARDGVGIAHHVHAIAAPNRVG